MARFHQLEKLLSRALKAPAKKKPDSYSHARRQAKALAGEHGFEIEKLDGGGFNVWAPAAIADTPNDPYDGDHYASDWHEVLAMAKEYARIAAEGQGGHAS